MSGSLEEAYVAVERAYGQGDFATALQLAETLRPQVQAGRSDLLDQRLQLLLGHIHLYGLNQPGPAATAYAAVLETCNEPAYRDLASQGLDLSRQQLAAAPGNALERAGTPGVGQTSPQPQPSGAAPATPWLSQLQDPQLALQQIQSAPAAVATTAPAQPAPGPGAIAAPISTPEAQPGLTPAQTELPPAEAEAKAETAAVATDGALNEAAAEPPPVANNSGLAVQPADQPPPEPDTNPTPDPEAIIPVVVTVEEDTPAQQEAADVSASANREGMGVAEAQAEPAAARFSEEEWAKLSRGLLLVELSSSQES